MVWTQLPPPRANPLDATGRKWMDDVKPPVRPFPTPPSSGDDFFKDSLIIPVVRSEDALLFHEVQKNSHSYCRTIASSFPTGSRHVFANDPPFVKVMEKAGIAGAIKASPRLGVFRRVKDLNCVVQRWSRVTHTFFIAWGEFTPTLEDVHVLMRLPLFGDYDVSSGPVDSHIIDRAKELKAVTIEGANYSIEFLAKLRANAPPFSDTPQRKVRGTGNVLLPGQRKMARESLKYTYATWIRYFFGDFDLDKKNFLPGPSLPQPLKRAAFLAFWLSKYVFSGPPWESVSSSVFIMACLLAEGVRLPLASFYLVFLQSFLFERFLEYAPVQSIPDPSRDGKAPEVEPHVWSLYTVYIRRVNLLPATLVLPVLKEYMICGRSFLALSLQTPCQLLGGAFWPYAYRPDRVCRQFGIDHPPCSLDLGFCNFSEAMKAVLFKASDAIPPFDASKFIPPDNSGRVLDLWVAYRSRLKSSVRRYEQQDSLQVFPDVKIMCKDPYYVTTLSKAKKQGKSSAFVTALSLSCFLFTIPFYHLIDESPNKGVKKLKSSQSEPVQPKPQKPPSRSPTLKKMAIDTNLPKRTSSRLRAKPQPGRVPPPPTSPSHPIEVPAGDIPFIDKPGSLTNFNNCVVQDSPLLTTPHATPQGSPTTKATSGEATASDRASTPSGYAGEDDQSFAPFDLASDHSVGAPKESPSKEVACSKTIGSLNTSFTQSAVPQVVVPLSSAPSLSKGFLVLDSSLPPTFLKPANTLFADLLRFLCSHTVVKLIGASKGRVLSDLKALLLFGFKGAWVDELHRRLDQPIPPAALEDLHKVSMAVRHSEQCVTELREHFESVKAELDRSVIELDHLKAKEKEIEEARASLGTLFDL
ncbi:Aminotransferase-like, plant mobile domain [Sesbania bispinosa]|nr:Aminotransferase-like, plant mobile domain [Sesbania bispinosa]